MGEKLEYYLCDNKTAVSETDVGPMYHYSAETYKHRVQYIGLFLKISLHVCSPLRPAMQMLSSK